MLTTEQAVLFKAAFLAETDPELASYRTFGQTPAIFNWYNQAAIPDFIVWKTNLAAMDIYADPGFNFTLVDGLTQGKRDEWSSFILHEGFCDPSKPNIRAGIADVWSGTAAKLAVQTAIIALSKRKASRIEKLFATGTGTTVDPATAFVNLQFTEQDVTLAMAP